jgi:DNA polymerase-3 subunit gamma/tau
MSYQVLARKWRPHTFAQVVGQQHVLKPLINALQTGRLHHAWLLTGTRGVGKTTIARILAKSLNCEQGLSAEPCGQCGACKAIEEGRFVDLLEIDAASRTKVEDTRELLDNVQYKPTQGRYKVYLIDEVHMLSKHSFNALLKTLEEPPPHVKFLLATTDPHKLPITVLSRCLQFNLKALGRHEIASHLATVLSAEAIPFDEAALALLARAAQGSMRDALSLTDQAIAQGEQAVTLEAVQHMLGAVPSLQLVKILRAIISADAQSMMSLLDQVAGHVPDVASLLPELQNLVHQLALLQVLPSSAEALGVGAAELDLAKQLPAELIQVYYDILVQGRRDLNYAADTRAGVEITLLRLLAFRPQTIQLAEMTPGQALNEPQQAVSEVTPAPRPKPTTERAAASSPQPESKPEPEPEPDTVLQAAVQPAAADDLQALLATRSLLQQKSQQLAAAKPAAATTETPSRYQSALQQPTAAVLEPAVPAQPEPPEPQLQPAVTPMPADAQAKPLNDDVKLAAEVDRWAAMIDNLDLTGLSRQIARNAVLQKQHDGSFQLLLRASLSNLLSDSVVEHLQQQLQHGYDLQLTAVVVADSSDATPYEIQQQIDQRRLARAQQTLDDDPTVKALTATFAAELVNDSVKPL